MTDYRTILPKGKENAIPSAELMKLMGFRTVRELQADVAEARKAGQVILSATTGGYYLPKDDAEIEEFVAVLRARAINTFRALQSAKEALAKSKGQITGQMDFDDILS